MYSIPVSSKQKKDPLTLHSLHQIQRHEKASNTNHHLQQILKSDYKRFSQSQGSLVPPYKTKLPVSSKNDIKSSKLDQYPHHIYKMDPRNKNSTKMPDLFIKDKVMSHKDFQINRQRASLSSENKKPSDNDKVVIDSSIKHNNQELSLLPLKMPHKTTLSPLDALKAKAEAELNKHPPEKKFGKSEAPNFGKLDLQWTKDLASVNKELHKLEASIGVDKRQSIAHFRSTVSPSPHSCEKNLEPFNSFSPKSSSLSPKPFQSKENFNLPLLPPPSQRASLPLMPTSNTIITKPKRVSITLPSEHQDTKSNYFSYSSSTSSAGSLPITPKNDSAILQPEFEFSPTLAQELAWERRQRFLLEVRLSEEKERCQKLEQELLKLKFCKH